MRGVVIVSRFWTALFSAGQASAVTVFPFIFIAEGARRADRALLNHENIHIRQALELGILFFYLWYLLEFLVRYIQKGDFRKAYLSICFEREAYRHESDLGYLRNRPFWAFRWFLREG